MAKAGKKSQAEALAAAARALSDRKAPNRVRTPRPDAVASVANDVVALTPTPEQERHGRFELLDVVDKRAGGSSITIGKAYRRRPMIDILYDQEVFSDAEHKALRHYRYHADIADRSPLRDSLNKQRGGYGVGPTVEMLNAMRVRDDCERAAGVLVDILRAVVVDDMSLSQWVMNRYGSIEECETRKGKRVCRLKPRDSALGIARIDLQMAAKRVRAELDA